MIALLLISVAGGLGAVARFVLDGAITSWSTKSRSSRSHPAVRYPVGTMVINVTGSLLLGLFTGLGLQHALSERWQLVLGTGFLGGYTTFSTASFETVRLLQERRWWAGLTNCLGMLVGSVAVAAVGLWLGLRL